MYGDSVDDELIVTPQTVQCELACCQCHRLVGLEFFGRLSLPVPLTASLLENNVKRRTYIERARQE